MRRSVKSHWQYRQSRKPGSFGGKQKFTASKARSRSRPADRMLEISSVVHGRLQLSKERSFLKKERLPVWQRRPLHRASFAAMRLSQLALRRHLVMSPIRLLSEGKQTCWKWTGNDVNDPGENAKT